jgi:hypothetical protein
LFHGASASGGYRRVIANVPCGHALRQKDGYIVGCRMMVNQLHGFLSIKLYEELIMSTELETTREKTITVKFEELSPVIRVSLLIEVGIKLGTF